jgi:hypothetical protein
MAQWEQPENPTWEMSFVIQLSEGGAVMVSGEKSDWKMPACPPPGVTTHPDWEAYPFAEEPSDMATTFLHPWLLGLDRQYGNPVQAKGQVALFGHPEATCHWLIQHCLQALQTNPQGLVILDGKGDLVPQLKRRPAVTNLLDNGLTYLDMSQPMSSHGLNLLAPAPGETEVETLQRWQTWFLGMGVSSLALPLLEAAQKEGVADLPAFQQWLKMKKRQTRDDHIAQLGEVVKLLLSGDHWQEWLGWGTNVWAEMPAHSLLVNCPQDTWQSKQVLSGLLLAILNMPTVRFILYGFPWQEGMWELVQQHHHWLMADPPEPMTDTTILVKSSGKKQRRLSEYFLPPDEQLRENFMLLRQGEAVVVQAEAVYGVTWKKDIENGEER